MNKKPLILLLTAFLLSGCRIGSPRVTPSGGGQESGGGSSSGGGIDPVPSGGGTEEGDKYDEWCNSWSKPGHLYFHYNRGKEATDYNNYCLWLWQFSPDSIEGALWGFDGPTKIGKTELKPMSTSFMQNADVGKTGTGNYVDDYGIIIDVDLYRSDLVGGKTGLPTTYVGADAMGFLLPLKSSMDGTTNWTSDGGTETYIEDWAEEKNWRDVGGEHKAIHVFVSSGALDKYSFYAGSGVSPVKKNPVDSDNTGKFKSAVETIPMNNYHPATSNAFKDVGAGYQVFVASFRDSNGDGMGDLRGVIDSLDYFEDLGVKALWLTPIQQSGSYHGYDIADYFAVDKRFGTIDDYRELIYKAHEKGIKVLMDLVLNHTSKSNVWYQKSKWAVNSGEAGTETDETGINWRNVYTWKLGTDKIKKAVPVYDTAQKKWVVQKTETITVEEDARSDNPSWYRDGESNYYYYGKFGSAMPEINYENKQTRQLVINMAKYWLSFGLDGFRLDAVKHIYMNDEVDASSGDVIVTDVGEARSFDDEKGQYITKKFDYSSNTTKNVNWWKEFSYELKSINPDCFLVGENFDGWGERISPYYDALDSQFDFSNYYHVPAYLYNNAGGASCYNGQNSETFEKFVGHRSDYINGAFTSNHDVMRSINHANGVGDINETIANNIVEYGNKTQNDKAKIQAALAIINQGTSWIYYGDELGMTSNTNTHITKYGNENCMDIWYRQPFLWEDTKVRSNYKNGQYKIELDEHNKSMSNNHDGITYDSKTGTVSTTNSFYDWYKQCIAIKNAFPKGAMITYENCTLNIIIIHVKGNGQEMMIYINTGVNTNDYMLNPGSSYQEFATVGNVTGSNIGACPITIKAYKK